MPFNQEKANRCTEFIQTLKLGDDFKGQRFYLLEWQREALEEFYGTVKENGYRQYHYLYLEMPKKNGKTQLAAGLGVYHLTADGATDGEIYICAADKANASIAFNAAVSMISQSKYLTKRLKIKASVKEIYDPLTNSKMKVLSADAYSKHGYKPTCVIFDELHAQPSRDLWDVMTFGSGSARKQPVYIVLTTAGDDPDHKSIGWEIHEKARKIKEAREGNKEYEDIPTWLPIIYGLGGDPEDISKVDIYDEEVWYRCNPSLGHTISIETLREEARDAKSSPGAERLFRWLRLNQWISVKNVGWLPLTEYDDTELIIDESELLHCPCWGGVDLSSTTDLTCITLTFPPYKKRNFFYQLYFPYITAEKMRERQQRDHVPFEDWVQDGYVLTTPGRTINHDTLADKIISLSKIYDLKWIGFDPYSARYIENKLQNEGINTAEISQGILYLSEPCKEFERMILNRQIFHGHNPCARWCFGNSKICIDCNGNQKIIKTNAIERVDVTVSAEISIAMWMMKPVKSTIFYAP